MNLSKITVGVAVSLCLVSNVVIADEINDRIADNIQQNELNLYKNLLNDFYKTYEKNNLNDFFKKHQESIDRIRMDSPDSPSWASLNKREIETILSDLNAEQRKDLISAYGYGNAVRLLTELKDAKDEKGQGLYYIFKSLDNTQSINSKLSENNSIRVLENLKKISNNEDNIKNIQVEINKVSNDIKKNNKELDKLNSNLDKNSNNIEFNRKRIEFLSKNLNEIIDLKISLNNLKKKLNRGLAAQSALTGLFQPYSVGKMNVTAAVGGYQSEKAIAVGSGYRFNDNFAAKVGLSKSLGGSAVSYNMGVNYEF